MRINLRVALDDARLRSYERALLGALFGPSPAVPSEVLLSGVKQRFQAAISSIDARLYDAVTDAGFFVRNPQTTRRIWYALSVTLIALGIVLAVGASVWLIDVVPIVFLPGTALLLMGVVLALIAGTYAAPHTRRAHSKPASGVRSARTSPNLHIPSRPGARRQLTTCHMRLPLVLTPRSCATWSRSAHHRPAGMVATPVRAESCSCPAVGTVDRVTAGRVTTVAVHNRLVAPARVALLLRRFPIRRAGAMLWPAC